MPASAVALTVLAAPASPGGPTWDEQASTVSPGNKFAADGLVLLHVRNTTASAINVVFEADLYGTERTLLQVSIPGSGTENGGAILGPFPASFLDHTTTAAADNGSVFVRQASGTAGQLVFCPFRVNTGIRG